MGYKPELSQTATLPTGAVFNMHFDHPNNNGLSPSDHAHAAHWHAQRAQDQTKVENFSATAFHQAQAILHANAAQGIVNHKMQVTAAPHDPTKDVNAKEHNKLMDELAPFRLNAQLAGAPVNKAKLADFIKNRGKLTKSSFTHPTIDLQDVKRVEQDREPPKPPLHAIDATHPGYGDLIKQAVKNRKAERNGTSSSDDTSGTPQLDENHKELIRAAIARRHRG
jgi:hypothetical protein